MKNIERLFLRFLVEDGILDFKVKGGYSLLSLQMGVLKFTARKEMGELCEGTKILLWPIRLQAEGACEKNP